MQHLEFPCNNIESWSWCMGERGGDTNTINKIQKKECKCKISLQHAMLGAGAGGWGRGPDQIPNTSTEYNKEYKK